MKARRVLITGGTGLLGQALLEAAPAGWEISAAYHQTQPPSEWQGRFFPLELCDPASVDRLFRQVEPEVVIHAASVGSVDEAEQHPERVHQVNVGGTRQVGEACRRTGAFLITLSSNAVFDGRHPPYSENSPTLALNQYGRFKIEAEEWVKRSGLSYLIIRPILLYGWPLPGGRSNVVTRWLNSLEKGQSVEVAEDIYSMPLLAANGAEAIWTAVKRRCQGIVHLAGPDRIALVDFARRTARAFGCTEERVVPVHSSRLGLAAVRPKDTSFVITRMQSELGIRPLGVEEGLACMVRCRAAVC